MMQVRLFRQAQIAWNFTAEKCSKLFNAFGIYDYIKTCYGFFHVQGDEANLADIASFLKKNGAAL